jgi:hypothetical protein
MHGGSEQNLLALAYLLRTLRLSSGPYIIKRVLHRGAIDQIYDNCVGSVIFSFMDGFSGYNQIDILSDDQHKTTFILSWGTFSYRKLSFGIKIVGATFHWAMSYAFHDIKHIVETYLDQLPTHSSHCWDHIGHL